MADKEDTYDLTVEVSIRKSGTWRLNDLASSEVIITVPPEMLRAFALGDVVEACRTRAFRKLSDAEAEAKYKAECAAKAEAAETHDKAAADG